jgi:hypothetical protein
LLNGFEANLGLADPSHPNFNNISYQAKMANILIESLQNTLKDLHSNPYPEVRNPVGCKKRASVALVLRIRPTHNWPETHISNDHASGPTTTERPDQFFSQKWVQHGDPECVFIKRAARVGDRWTSHVALPGGKRGIDR